MNRIGILCMCAVLITTLFSACRSSKQDMGETEPQETVVPTTLAPETVPPVQEMELPDPMYLLIIGNSHSVDAFHYLFQAFQDQQPEREIVLGVLYYGGCSISQHVQFALSRRAVYTYYKNTDGQWNFLEETDMISVLEDQPWNVVMLQAAKSDLDDTLNEDARRELEAFVSKYVSEPPQFLWHTSWPSPNDAYFFSEDAVNPAPEGYKDNLVNLYGFDPITQFTVLTDMAKTHILSDRYYSNAVCTGAAIMHANLRLGISQREIWRDYTHLSDYGRLIAAYALYAQLTGTTVSDIGVNTIPETQRHKLFQHLGDWELTEQIKNTVIQSANYAREDPWSVPYQSEQLSSDPVSEEELTSTDE